jgi:hypothetical protein
MRPVEGCGDRGKGLLSGAEDIAGHPLDEAEQEEEDTLLIEIILLLLVLCLQAADLYLHLAGTQEKPRREIAHFDLAATDLKRTGRKRLKNDRT